MNSESWLQIFTSLDPLYLVAACCALIALALLWLAMSLPGKIRQLAKSIREATDRIAVADEARKRETTLTAVRRFESDTEIRAAVQHIWKKTKTADGVDYSLLDGEDRFQVVSYLNYLDGIAVGVKQGVLDESVAKDYLQHVVHKSVSGLLLGESGDSWKAGAPLVEPEPFENLILLHKQWKVEEVHPLFKMIGHGVT